MGKSNDVQTAGREPAVASSELSTPAGTSLRGMGSRCFVPLELSGFHDSFGGPTKGPVRVPISKTFQDLHQIVSPPTEGDRVRSPISSRSQILCSPMTNPARGLCGKGLRGISPSVCRGLRELEILFVIQSQVHTTSQLCEPRVAGVCSSPGADCAKGAAEKKQGPAT